MNSGKMILKIKSNFYQIFKLIFLLVLIGNRNLYAHNLFNGVYRGHSRQDVKPINDKKIFKNVKNQINDEIKNSCLKKSLCRG